MKSVFALIIFAIGAFTLLNLSSCKSDPQLKTDPNFVVERDTLAERMLQKEQLTSKKSGVPIHGNWRDTNDPTHIVSLDKAKFYDIQNGKIVADEPLVYHEKCPAECTDSGKGCFIVKGQCYVITQLEEDALSYRIGDKTFSFKRA